jgi:hypothetical protein
MAPQLMYCIVIGKRSRPQEYLKVLEASSALGIASDAVSDALIGH